MPMAVIDEETGVLVKQCSKCKKVQRVDKTLNGKRWYKDKNRKDGLKSQCPSCVAGENAKWYADNRERDAERCAKWRATNRERAAEYNAEWAAANPWKQLINTCRSSTRARILKGRRMPPVSIDKVWCESQWKKQGGRCYYFNTPMIKTRRSGKMNQVSIERIDNDLGYTPDNCVLVCQAANHMRSDHPHEDMFKMVQYIVDCQNRKNTTKI